MSIEGGIPGNQQRLVCPNCGKVFFAWRPDDLPGQKVKCYFCKHEFADEAALRPPPPAPIAIAPEPAAEPAAPGEVAAPAESVAEPTEPAAPAAEPGAPAEVAAPAESVAEPTEPAAPAVPTAEEPPAEAGS